MRAERVHAVWEYYDGVRTGIADYLGQPHYFEQEWSEGEQEYLPSFLLKPLAPITFAEATEQWAILRSWEARFHLGEIAQDTHPGKPGQNARYLELERKLRTAVGDSVTASARAAGAFTPVPTQPVLPPGVMREMQVAWHDVA